MFPVDYANSIIQKNYEIVSKLNAYCKIKHNIELVIKRDDKEALKEEIEAETCGHRIIIYEDVFNSLYLKGGNENYLRSITHTISHEFWHIYQARFKFYSRLERICIDGIYINKLEKKHVLEFVEKLNNLSDEDVDKFIHNLQTITSCWDDKYIYEQAWYDSKKKFLNRINSFKLRGIIEECFAEKYASRVSGIKFDMIPKVFDMILKKLLD